MADRERRDSERIDLLGTLHGDVLVVQATEIRQISRGGMLVETRFALHVDSLHDFRLSLGTRSVVVKGRVAHSRLSDVAQDSVFYLSGVEFVDQTEAVQSAILEFIDALRIARAQS